ncbi:MAG: polysaccharide biosynthesis/export family protein [Pseudomonadota bacterium]
MARAGAAIPIFAAALTLTACATLPSSGPTASQVLDEERQAASAIGYRFVDLGPATLGEAIRPDDGVAALAVLDRAPAPRRIGVGDRLDIGLYEVGARLFGDRAALPGAGFDPSAKVQALPGIEVEPDGTIDLPFAGRVEVAGLTPPAAADRIEQAYAGLSQDPQARVTVTRDLANSVLLTGAIGQPGRFGLTPAGERLSEAIALAGGPAAAPADVQVRFRRGDAQVDLPLSDIETGGPADLRLMPGDRVDLIAAPRTITAFGAVGRVQEIPFAAARLTLAEAVARAGGPSESTADPSAVFVFRDDPDAPTIYRADLLRPSGYFLAQRFQMRDGDLIYVANATANRPTKLLEIINRLFTPVIAINGVTQ